MSAIVGIFGQPAIQRDDATAARMLASAHRGDGPAAVLRGEDFVLGVRRHGWETAADIGGTAEVITNGSVSVVTDATLYHLSGLRQRLASAGITPTGNAPGDWVLAAYRAWGSSCAERLEGDFAFVLWDSEKRRLLCACDFAGKRPLHYAHVGDGLIIGSTLGSVLAHPLVPSALNAVSLAETAAALWQGNDETAYRAIRRLLPARSLEWSPGSPPRVRLYWEPPAQGSAPAPAFERDAEQLRELLCNAVAQRFPASGNASVWMSGGWDSSAVFAAGQEMLRRGTRRGSLDIVSISYPPGDPGREDELISSIAEHWSRPVNWIDIADMPMFDRTIERAAQRDDPFAHCFELWNRGLIARTRGLGARVAFDGNGGDQLFFTSNVFFADLLLRGRWRELRREWRIKGGTRFSDFFENAIQPILPAPLRKLGAALRGRPLRHVFERHAPSWIRQDFARANDLAGRERAHSPNPRRGGQAGREAYWYVMAPYFARAYGLLSSFALEAGIELRSPLLDRRVVEFAAARPREERNAGREIKRLLRRAMMGLLPPNTLTPRNTKTGTLQGYFAQHMLRDFPALADRAMQDSRLAALGIIEPGAYLAAVAEFKRTGNGTLGYALHQTAQVEFWLRARTDTPVQPDSVEGASLRHPGDTDHAHFSRSRQVASRS